MKRNRGWVYIIHSQSSQVCLYNEYIEAIFEPMNQLNIYILRDKLKTIVIVFLGFIILPFLLLSIWMFGIGDYQTIGYETAAVINSATRIPSKNATDSSGVLLTIKTDNNTLIAKRSLQGQYPEIGSKICLRKLKHKSRNSIRYEIATNTKCNKL